jgi:hypothetical protein
VGRHLRWRRFKGRYVVADPRHANKERALLAHDYQWCQHLAENPPHLTDARPKAVLEIVDVKDVLVLATDVEESA